MQQVNTTINHPAQSPFLLTDLLQLASPQGVLLTLKNPQEIMQTYKSSRTNHTITQRAEMLQSIQ